MRCTGQCCVLLQIGYHPAELQASYAAAVAGEMGYWFDGSWRFEIQDILRLYPMLECVGTAAKGDMVMGRERPADCYLYTCIHHQPDGDCAQYEQRPQMCSGFPYGEPCPYPGCAYAPDGCTQEPE